MSAFDGQPISHFRTEMAAKNEYLDRFTVVELAIVQATLDPGEQSSGRRGN